MVTIVDVDATWVNPNTVEYDAGELRRADAAGFAGVSSDDAGGIVRHTDISLLVGVDGSDEVTVQPGSVVIPGNAVAGTGVYRAGINAVASASLDARDGTNPRIDLVVFRQLDTDVVGSHGAYTGRIQIITGTPSATPSAPALPTMAVELGRINVPASGGGAASVDLSNCTYAAAIGGEIAVPTLAALPALVAVHQRAVVLDTGYRYTFNGAVWVPVDQVLNFVADSHLATPLSAVFGDVPGFAFEVKDGRTYAIDIIAFLSSPSSLVGWRYGFRWDGSGELNAGQSGLDPSVIAPDYSGDNVANAIGGDTSSPFQEVGGIATPHGFTTIARVNATFFATSDGTVQLQHAQNNSSPTNAAQFRKGSRMRVEPIA